jgi:hypothetical protein
MKKIFRRYLLPVFFIRYLQSVIGYPLSAIRYLLSAIHYLLSTIRYLLSAIPTAYSPNLPKQLQVWDPDQDDVRQHV